MNDNYFTIGAQVYCEDGKCGKLAKVVLDPESWQVTGLIAEEGILLKQARAFPTSIVASTSAEAVHVTINSDERTQYPEYSEHEVEMLPTEWDPAIRAAPEVMSSETAVEEIGQAYATPGMNKPLVRQKERIGVSDHLVVAGRNTKIMGRENGLGHLHCVMTNNQSNRITGLIVRAGLLDNERMLVPSRLVETFGDELIRISVTKEELEEMAGEVGQIQERADATDGRES